MTTTKTVPRSQLCAFVSLSIRETYSINKYFDFHENVPRPQPRAFVTPLVQKTYSLNQDFDSQEPPSRPQPNAIVTRGRDACSVARAKVVYVEAETDGGSMLKGEPTAKAKAPKESPPHGFCDRFGLDETMI